MADMVRVKVASAASAAEIAKSVASTFNRTSSMPTHVRAKILVAISEGIEKEAEAFAELICEEVAKPLKEARREVNRAVFCFRWAAEECRRFGGEMLPLDLDANSEERIALTRRAPRGPALLISPFNFPLNLVAHKVAPAIAVGAPFVLKPAPHAPKTADKLMEVVRAAGWPAEAGVAVECSNEVAEALVRDEHFAILSFTGSAKVGWHLKSVAGKKHVVLELGGNAGVIVGADADLPWAAARCAWGAFYYSGQVCISVQRIFVEAPVYDEFKKLLIANIAELKVGDVRDDSTDIGPLIDDKSADRIEEWIKEAVKGGGKIAAGGNRGGRVIDATLIENAPDACKLSCEEAFGPVATIEKVSSREAALDKLAAGSYGLQAGLFTNDMRFAMSAWRRVPVGGLIVNDIPAYRSDAMPYGGVRDSGMGREGARYAMEEFTELRTLVLKP
jgi:acyl-CoA reductase-like NAD-dependent aldehyde dehydrogenase